MRDCREPSIRALRTAALFGIDLDEERAEQRERRAPGVGALRRIVAMLGPGRVVHLTGPSGAGKSTLLRAIADQLSSDRDAIVIDPSRIDLPDRPCVELFPGPLVGALGDIARAGLAEARCFLRPAHELSEGERARLRLALALRRAGAIDPRPAVIVADEFGATLDRPTARCVARCLRRAVRDSANACALTATGHDDLDAPLQPDCWLHLSQASIVQRCPGPDLEPVRDIVIEPGGAHDREGLARFHYRPGPVAAPVRTLRARHTELDETIAVLVVAMPTLNAPWRELAWPGRYTTADRRADARRVNAEIRRIARVVVDPRFRGQGLARRLVRAYLDDPQTPCTEACAVMGGVAPFFERAGMTSYALAPKARDARLLDALDHAGVPAYLTASPAGALARAGPEALPFITREVRRWANDSRAHRRWRGEEFPSLFRRACRAVAGVPVGYAHTRGHDGRP